MKECKRHFLTFCFSYQLSTINYKLLTMVASLICTLTVFGAGTENILTDLGYGAGESAVGETGYLCNPRATVIKSNVSALSLIDKINMEWTHTELNYSQWNDYIAFAAPFECCGKEMGVGMSWNRLWVDGIPLTEEGDTIDGTDFTEIINNGTANYTLNEYGLGVGGKVSIISIGAYLKYTHGNLADYSLDGIGADAGVSTVKEIDKGILGRIGAALTVKDIAGTRIYWSTGTQEKTDMKAEIGLSAGLFPDADGNERLNIEAGFTRRFLGSSETEIKGGVEYFILPIIPLRIGYNGEALSGGIGIETERVRVDYSISDKAELEPVHKISLGLVF